MSEEPNEWAPEAGSMLTEWGQQISPETVWREYPRPQMVRDNWENLNGMWNYAVTGLDAQAPDSWQGEILVPFCIEAPLSGVGHLLQPNEALWYKRNFSLNNTADSRILLNFEAVDYICSIWVNDQLIGQHRGGNLPFSFDISNAIKAGSNEIRLRVVDASDSEDSYQLRGKQVLNNKGIFYTRVSGIWQTVWMESVPESYIESMAISTLMDGKVHILTKLNGLEVANPEVKAFVSLNGHKVGTFTGGTDMNFEIEEPDLWSPDSPTLYDLTLQLRDSTGMVIDTVESYFGIREVGKVQDAKGELGFSLNGKEIFHLGTLDQGWWPDGLLTPPSDKAMEFEIRFLKSAGFNMIRKHIKVEPRRYYALCDRIGMLVWQDHVSGGKKPKWKRLNEKFDENWKAKDNPNLAGPDDALDAEWPEEAHEQFILELSGMLDHLNNHPSIVVWVLFNERWGQHRTMEVGKWIKDRDPSRHINVASGGNFFPVGDIADEHNYPNPLFPLSYPEFDGYIKVIGEFGGHGYPVAEHLWDPDKRNWGYGELPETANEYRERYVRTATQLGELKRKGIAAGVYTQTSDVEGEINGLMTYDRKILKLKAEDLKQIHVDAGLMVIQ